MTQPPATPPLTWLRAFEAAARLGAPLFAKQGRGVTLTAEGNNISVRSNKRSSCCAVRCSKPPTNHPLRQRRLCWLPVARARAGRTRTDHGGGCRVDRPWFAARRVQMIAALTTRIDERAYLVYGPHNEHKRDIARLHEWLKAVRSSLAARSNESAR
jgi:hypothetical protein